MTWRSRFVARKNDPSMTTVGGAGRGGDAERIVELTRDEAELAISNFRDLVRVETESSSAPSGVLKRVSR